MNKITHLQLQKKKNNFTEYKFTHPKKHNPTIKTKAKKTKQNYNVQKKKNLKNLKKKKNIKKIHHFGKCFNISGSILPTKINGLATPPR